MSELRRVLSSALARWVASTVVNFVMLSVLVGTLMAQPPCTSEWDGTLGRPGISGGYVGAFAVFDDRRKDETTESIFVGGSFTQGPGSSAYLARYNIGSKTWSRPSGGIGAGSTNAFITSLVPFNHGSSPGLFVGGFFDKAGGVANTRSLAVYGANGNWRALPNNPVNTSPASVWSMAVWPNDPTGSPRIYVGGAGLADVGTTPSNGIQAWDGTQFHPVATVNGPFAPTVFKLLVHNDGSGEKLYAGGRLNNLQGVMTPLIMRYDGTTWSKVGNGLIATDTNFAQISAMCEHDDGTGKKSLYVAGGSFRVNGSGQTVTSVAKWDGTAWTRVGQNVGGIIYGLESWDDGSGPGLYIGGTAVPTISYIARLFSGNWLALDNGVSGSVSGNFPSVFALGQWNGNLLVGGDFTTAGASEPANGLVMRTTCVGACETDYTGDGFSTGDDFDAFVLLYVAGDPAADYNQNGFVTGDDFDAFVVDFIQGC